MRIMMIVLILAAFILFVSVVFVLYNRSEKKHEERRRMESKKDPDMNSNATLNQMALKGRYDGLSTRGRIN